MSTNTSVFPERRFRREYCDECGVDPEFYKNQIYCLTEKLEFSTMQMLKLSAECNRLHKELREAEFLRRSSVSKRSPLLPNELLREIFSFATHLESDLVSPHWELERPYTPWVISSQARRSIPLVCRQWHHAGLEYLYKHIVICMPSQLFKLLDVFKGLEPDAQLHAKYVGWIRGLEFVILRHDVDSETEFTLGTCDLIYRLPRGRLRVFGFEDGQCHGSHCYNILEILRAGIIVSQKSSQALHFPVLLVNSHSVEDHPSADLDNPVVDAGVSIEEPIDFYKLETLSISGSWDKAVRSAKAASFFAAHVHSIRTIYLKWFYRTECLHLLRAAALLETIYLLDDSVELMKNFEQLLTAAPQLKRLFIGLTHKCGYNPRILADNAIIHTSLEEITFITNSAWTYTADTLITNDVWNYIVDIIFPIFYRIEDGCLPKLIRVVVCGPYPNGWLDAAVHDVQYEKHWKSAIKTCEGRGVDLVDGKGNAIHLWRTRRGYRVGSESDVTDSEIVSSDEGEYWETRSSGYSGSLGADDVISEDSEDSPYRYISQRDLDYDSRSDSSDS